MRALLLLAVLCVAVELPPQLPVEPSPEPPVEPSPDPA